MNELRLNRKETFAVSMVMFIGFFYVVSLTSALLETHSVTMVKTFGITEIKFLLLSIIFLGGAVSFFRVNKSGWIICTASLLNFVLVVARLVIAVSQDRKPDAFAAMLVLFFILVLMAFLFLFSKETRNKFMVTNKSYLLMIMVYGVLVALTFLL